MVAEVFYFYAGAVDKHLGETIPVAGGVDMTFREPLGVVGLIAPWNFPLTIASWKLGPALATGNTVVLKPAELTPLTALRLAELMLEAGIPDGVRQRRGGPRSAWWRQALCEHPHVAKIGFTGSTEVGRGVMQSCCLDHQARHARARRKVGEHCFLRRRPGGGGIDGTVCGVRERGQDCCARSRILVERSAYDRFVELLVSAAEGVKLGDPESPETEMGPLVSAGQRETVSSYVDGNVAYQGNTPGGPGFAIHLATYLHCGNPEEEAYARRYTVFAVAEYMTWVEIVRRELRFLDVGDEDRNRQLLARLTKTQVTLQSDKIRGPFRVFRGRQRAIAELMMVPTGATEGPQKECIGYAAFSDRLDEDRDFAGWFTGLLDDVDLLVSRDNDDRIIQLQNDLVDLIDHLDPKTLRIPPDFRHRLNQVSPIPVPAQPVSR